MNREAKKYLFDVKTSIESIDEYLGEKEIFSRISTIRFCVEQSSVKLKSSVKPLINY